MSIVFSDFVHAVHCLRQNLSNEHAGQRKMRSGSIRLAVKGRLQTLWCLALDELVTFSAFVPDRLQFMRDKALLRMIDGYVGICLRNSSPADMAHSLPEALRTQDHVQYAQQLSLPNITRVIDAALTYPCNG